LAAAKRGSASNHLPLAHILADVAGRAVLPHFRKPLQIENKASAGSGFDPVTAADRAAERAISRHLAKAEPDHGMVGEEFGRRDGAGQFTWVIDPIDGTKAFIMGSPLWCTLIGLLDHDAPALGIMDQPFTGERVWSSGRSTHWRLPDGRVRRVRTRSCARLQDAILTTTSPDLLGGKREVDAFHRLKDLARMTRYGGDGYGYCLLAGGHVDLIVETGLKAYDIVALIPIIEQAGGRVTTWEGGPADKGGRIVASGDPRLHEIALRILNP
jgi:histidinol phosphatase-like enzyme (inositol monophosphatase family)